MTRDIVVNGRNISIMTDIELKEYYSTIKNYSFASRYSKMEDDCGWDRALTLIGNEINRRRKEN